MNMIFGDVTFQNLYIQGFTNLSAQVTYSDGHVSKEYRLPVFRYPHNMDF